MNNYVITMAISVLLQTIKESVKNPARKKTMKAALLKVRDSINMLYAGDKDFE